MDLQNFNQHQYQDTLSSPTYDQIKSYIISTPKTNKSIHDSKSPFRRLKLKKSKRRECTPAYSPKMSHGEKNIFHYYPNTEKKANENILFKLENKEHFEKENKVSQRLSFDDFNSSNLFSNNNCIVSEEPPKKKFISLIEDSLNELDENYYGLLCSQITPDTIFKTIFTDEDKGKKSKSGLQSEEDVVYSAVNKILLNLKNKNFEELVNMNSQIILITKDLDCNQLNLNDFALNFLDLAYDIQLSSFSSEANQCSNSNFLIFVPGKICFSSCEFPQNARFIFEVNPSQELCMNQVRLSVIEIQFS